MPKLSPVIPEAERSEAIRDLHQRVELPRSRIGALLAQALASPKGPMAGMTGGKLRSNV
jgi:hypothetical protein